MSRHQDRCSLPLSHRDKELVQPVARNRIEAFGRFIEQQDPRLVQQSSGQSKPAGHALGIGHDRSVGGLAQVQASQSVGNHLS